MIDEAELSRLWTPEQIGIIRAIDKASDQLRASLKGRPKEEIEERVANFGWDALLQQSKTEEEFIQSWFKIRVEDEGNPLVTIKFNYGQRVLHQHIQRMEREKKPVRILVLKARRLGFSTFVQMYLTKRVLTQAMFRCAVIAHDKAPAMELFGMSSRVVDMLPFKPAMKTDRRDEIQTTKGGKYTVVTANNDQVTRGLGVNWLHLCLHPDTKVLKPDGRAVRIADIEPGDRVLTDSGVIAPVLGISATPAHLMPSGTRCLRIDTWTNPSEPLRLSPEHKVFTSNGWMQASRLKVGDEIGMPIRKILGTRTELPYEPRIIRSDGRPRTRKKGPPFRLDAATGFSIGFYLAEGTIIHQSTGPKRPSAVTFSHHERETDTHAYRAMAGLQDWTTSVRNCRHRGCHTATTTCYGGALAQLVEENFGTTDGKRLPEWIFDAPVEFLRGVVCGYLAGDGSTGMAAHGGYSSPTISATSIRPSFLYQIRDIMASLGLGWSSISFKAGGFRSGRTERDAWIMTINGFTAIAVRRMMHMEVPTDLEFTGFRRKWTQKWQATSGHVWMRVRAITEEEHAGSFYDIEVDHPDHSFRCAAGVVSNSEFAFYENAEVVHDAVMQTVSRKSGTGIIIESTANGMDNLFYELWAKAERGENDWFPLFVPWWQGAENRMEVPEDLTDRVLQALDEDERYAMKQYKLGIDQMAWLLWVRRNNCRNNADIRKQEYPSFSMEAFLSSGRPVFDQRRIEELRRKCTLPYFQGHLVWSQNGRQFPNRNTSTATQ